MISLPVEGLKMIQNLGSILGSGRYPWEGNGYPLQYSCLENPWTEEPGGVQYLGSQRVRQDWATNTYTVSSVQLLSQVQLCVTPWTAAFQACLSITNSWNLFNRMSIKSVMPPNKLILCCPLLLLPSIFPTIWVFANESFLCIRWPKY